MTIQQISCISDVVNGSTKGQIASRRSFRTAEQILLRESIRLAFDHRIVALEGDDSANRISS